jgi:hypothetical protein
MTEKYKYRVIAFSSNASGIKKKLQTIEQMEEAGWEVHDESIEKASFDGPAACCMAFICLPLIFLGFSKERVLVTFKRPK